MSEAPHSTTPPHPTGRLPLHPSLRPRSTPPPAPARTEWWVNLILFVTTIVTCLMAGAMQIPIPLDYLFLEPLEYLWAGSLYAAPVLAILVAHESGHYLAARHHGVEASLPYFIPVPFGIGTLGAVIRMRAVIHSRNALLDIALAGPIAGFLVAIPVLVFGTIYSDAVPLAGIPAIGGPNFYGEPLIHKLLVSVLRNDPPGTTLVMNPIAMAGWVGLLVTYLNLFPIGQLDGGHVRYALLGNRGLRVQAWIAKAMLAWGALGLANQFLWIALETEGPLVRFLLAWCSPAFFVWGLLMVLVFGRAGWEHPPVLEWEPLSPGRRLLAAAGILVFLLVFMPAPIATELG